MRKYGYFAKGEGKINKRSRHNASNSVQLINPDFKATDIRYKHIQNMRESLKPPSLALDSVEQLYKITRDLLDAKFKAQIKHDFAACYSEMYFAATLRNRLKLRLTHPSDKGPDLFIDDLDCWAEVTTAGDGQEGNENSVPQIVVGKGQSFPEDQVILRLTNAFISKARIIEGYIDKQIIQPDQKVIICISGGWMSECMPMYPVGGYPQIVKALLPIGDLELRINRDTKKIIDQEYQYRDNVTKKAKNGHIPISTQFFLDPYYSFVSGVLYSHANAFDPIELDKLGCDFFFVHNPLAKNKIVEGAIKCGQEYVVQADAESFTMKPVNHEKS